MLEAGKEQRLLDLCTVMTVKVYQCKICLESITNFDSFQEHLDRFHATSKLEAINDSDADDDDDNVADSSGIHLDEDSRGSFNEDNVGSTFYDDDEIDVDFPKLEPQSPEASPVFTQSSSWDKFCDDRLSDANASNQVDASSRKSTSPGTDDFSQKIFDANRRYIPEPESPENVTDLILPETRTSRRSSSGNSDLENVDVEEAPEAKRPRVEAASVVDETTSPFYFNKLTQKIHGIGSSDSPPNIRPEAPAATKREPLDRGSVLIDYALKIPIGNNLAEFEILPPAEGSGSRIEDIEFEDDNNNNSDNDIIFTKHDGFFCLYCSSTFGTDLSLKIHIAEKHRDIRPYCCYVCPESFYTRYHFNLHIQRDHPDLMPLSHIPDSELDPDRIDIEWLKRRIEIFKKSSFFDSEPLDLSSSSGGQLKTRATLTRAQKKAMKEWYKSISQYPTSQERSILISITGETNEGSFHHYCSKGALVSNITQSLCVQ